MITYGTLHANGGERTGFSLDEARAIVKSDYRKGYITHVTRYVDGEFDYFWEDEQA